MAQGRRRHSDLCEYAGLYITQIRPHVAKASTLIHLHGHVRRCHSRRRCQCLESASVHSGEPRTVEEAFGASCSRTRRSEGGRLPTQRRGMEASEGARLEGETASRVGELALDKILNTFLFCYFFVCIAMKARMHRVGTI